MRRAREAHSDVSTGDRRASRTEAAGHHWGTGGAPPLLYAGGRSATGGPPHDHESAPGRIHAQHHRIGTQDEALGGDRQLREIAQKIQDEQQAKIDALKQWQVRSREAGYRPQPNQTPSGEGPLDRRAKGDPAQTPSTADLTRS